MLLLLLKPMQKILNKLQSCWCAETSYYPNKWNSTNPAYGQCLPTALVLQDYLGGDVHMVMFGRSRHYYCVIPGESGDTILDATCSQYANPNLDYSSSTMINRKQILKNKNVRKRYELLKQIYDDANN